jgi:plastocyanin
LVVRSKWLPWLACAVVAAIGFPALAQGESESAAAEASIVAFDNGFRDGSQSDPADNTVQITAGETVSFSYPSGSSGHNVKFDAAQPASCTQTAGPPLGPVPPLPAFAVGPGWSGDCRFDTPGTYTFFCTAHPDMKGTVEVTAGATPTPTATATASPTPTATPTATASPEPTPVAAASVTARDNAYDNADVKVKPGEYVHFAYPEGAASHNVDFKDATKPVCKQTAGPPVGDSPPLPKYALPKGWAGDCRFDSPGTYTFVCDAHPAEMKGTVTVAADTQPTAVPAVVRDNDPAPNPKAWASLEKPAAKRATVAVLLQGKLKLTARCTAVDKGTLTLTVTKAVAKKLKLKSRTLATGSSRCNGNGRFSATLKPSAAVRRALKHYRKAVRATAMLRLGAVTTSRAITLGRAR